MSVLLFNDTSNEPHIGCQAVSDAQRRYFRRIGETVSGRYFNRETRDLATSPGENDIVRRVLDSDLADEIRASDRIVVNGEGTIHHGRGLDLLGILAAAQQLGRETYLINAVLEQVSSFHQTLSRLDGLTVRDAASSRYLKGLDIPHRVLPDSILDAGFSSRAGTDLHGKVVVTDWHSQVDDTVGRAMQGFIETTRRATVRYPLHRDDAHTYWHHGVADMATAGCVVTARHHGAYLAAMAGRPFLLLGSNTHKMEGFVEMLGRPIPFCRTVEEIEAGVEFALAHGDMFLKIRDELMSRAPLEYFGPSRRRRWVVGPSLMMPERRRSARALRSRRRLSALVARGNPAMAAVVAESLVADGSVGASTRRYLRELAEMPVQSEKMVSFFEEIERRRRADPRVLEQLRIARERGLQGSKRAPSLRERRVRLGGLVGEKATLGAPEMVAPRLAKANAIALARQRTFVRLGFPPGVTDLELRKSCPYFGFITPEIGGCPRFSMFSNNDDVVAQRYFWWAKDAYESFTLRLWVQLARESSHTLDVGSYTGIYALAAASAHSQGRVHAFEPLDRLYFRLVVNRNANGLSNLRTVPRALADRPGEGKLHVHSGEGILATASSLRADHRKVHEVKSVQVDSLDRMMGDGDIGGCDLIKIDAGHAEDLVLRGGRDTLARHRPQVICELSPGSDAEALRECFAGLGYGVYGIDDDGSDIFEIDDVPVRERGASRLFFSARGREDLRRIVSAARDA